jgi:hypothetical protein
MVKQETKLVAMISKLCNGMINELHIPTSTMSNDWWYDFGATIHICNNKNHFKDYEVAQDGQKVLMRNSNAIKVRAKGSVELNFTSRNKLLLDNVLHILDIRKNLVFVNLLCKKGFTVVLESDKIILS